jgi:hypothetical protein
MAATAMVVPHEISFSFPSTVTRLVNDEATGFDLFDIEEYFGREVKNIDDAEATFDDNGQIVGVTLRKMSAVNPIKGITLQFNRALKSLWSCYPFPDLHQRA